MNKLKNKKAAQSKKMTADWINSMPPITISDDSDDDDDDDATDNQANDSTGPAAESAQRDADQPSTVVSESSAASKPFSTEDSGAKTAEIHAVDSANAVDTSVNTVKRSVEMLLDKTVDTSVNTVKPSVELLLDKTVDTSVNTVKRSVEMLLDKTVDTSVNTVKPSVEMLLDKTVDTSVNTVKRSVDMLLDETVDTSVNTVKRSVDMLPDETVDTSVNTVKRSVEMLPDETVDRRCAAQVSSAERNCASAVVDAKKPAAEFVDVDDKHSGAEVTVAGSVDRHTDSPSVAIAGIASGHVVVSQASEMKTDKVECSLKEEDAVLGSGQFPFRLFI